MPLAVMMTRRWRSWLWRFAADRRLDVEDSVGVALTVPMSTSGDTDARTGRTAAIPGRLLAPLRQVATVVTAPGRWLGERLRWRPTETVFLGRYTPGDDGYGPPGGGTRVPKRPMPALPGLSVVLI
jgi:hypothetical protein